MNKLSIVAISVALTPLLSITEGFVLFKLWAWFMVPLLSLPALNLGGCIGVGAVISFVTYQYNSSSNQGNEDLIVDLVQNVTNSLVRSIVFLVFGSVLHLIIS